MNIYIYIYLNFGVIQNFNSGTPNDPDDMINCTFHWGVYKHLYIYIHIVLIDIQFISQSYHLNPWDFPLKREAVLALQEAAEAYLVGLFEDR